MTCKQMLSHISGCVNEDLLIAAVLILPHPLAQAKRGRRRLDSRAGTSLGGRVLLVQTLPLVRQTAVKCRLSRRFHGDWKSLQRGARDGKSSSKCRPNVVNFRIHEPA
jgi:hypothetical protein